LPRAAAIVHSAPVGDGERSFVSTVVLPGRRLRRDVFYLSALLSRAGVLQCGMQAPESATAAAESQSSLPARSRSPAGSSRPDARVSQTAARDPRDRSI